MSQEAENIVYKSVCPLQSGKTQLPSETVFKFEKETTSYEFTLIQDNWCIKQSQQLFFLKVLHSCDTHAIFCKEKVIQYSIINLLQYYGGYFVLVTDTFSVVGLYF